MQCKCCTYKVSLILAILCIKRDIIRKKCFFNDKMPFTFGPLHPPYLIVFQLVKTLNPFFRLPINIINVQLQYFLCFICIFTLCLCFCFTDLIFFLFMTRLAAPHGSTRLKFFFVFVQKISPYLSNIGISPQHTTSPSYQYLLPLPHENESITCILLDK